MRKSGRKPVAKAVVMRDDRTPAMVISELLQGIVTVVEVLVVAQSVEGIRGTASHEILDVAPLASIEIVSSIDGQTRVAEIAHLM